MIPGCLSGEDEMLCHPCGYPLSKCTCGITDSNTTKETTMNATPATKTIFFNAGTRALDNIRSSWDEEFTKLDVKEILPGVTKERKVARSQRFFAEKNAYGVWTLHRIVNTDGKWVEYVEQPIEAFASFTALKEAAASAARVIKDQHGVTRKSARETAYADVANGYRPRIFDTNFVPLHGLAFRDEAHRSEWIEMYTDSYTAGLLDRSRRLRPCDDITVGVVCRQLGLHEGDHDGEVAPPAQAEKAVQS